MVLYRVKTSVQRLHNIQRPKDFVAITDKRWKTLTEMRSAEAESNIEDLLATSLDAT